MIDAPVPALLTNAALVRNRISVISSGTERAAVTRHGGVLGLYEKATKSMDRVRDIANLVQSAGAAQALEIVRNKLHDYTPLGYSCAGEVAEVNGDCHGIRPGDRVACMGTGYASHAEYVVVPRNLLAPLPAGVSIEEAAFGALACIALQGIRRLELTPGERVGVIGLGLIGQITLRLLDAMGYEPYGTDINSERIALAAVPGASLWVSGSGQNPPAAVQSALDGVIVCANSPENDVVNAAMDMCRQRGRVVIVGDVGLGVRRSKMYRNELELRLSCSYGPGRYDTSYEEGGRDYPIGFVRWTEKRSLAYILRLLSSGRLELGSLVSARFPVAKACDAYRLVLDGGPSTFGVLLTYEETGLAKPTPIAEMQTLRRPVPARVPGDRRIRLGVIGPGGYFKGGHLPHLRSLADRFEIRGVASRSGASAGAVARSVGAGIVTSDYRALLAEPGLDAVMITTRHHSHAQIILDALSAGKHVFVEKPMTTTVEDAQRVCRLARETGLVVRVGFNRRFAPYSQALRAAIGMTGPRMASIRVNIGKMPRDWSNTAGEGGRFLGEAVHFLDFLNWLFSEEPESVSSYVAGAAEVTNSNTVVQVHYAGQSVAQLLYTSLGHPKMGKEAYEVFGNQHSARMADFRRYESFGGRKSGLLANWKLGGKGQREVLEEFAAAIQGQSYPVAGADARAGLVATWMALAARDSAATGIPQRLSQPEAAVCAES